MSPFTYGGGCIERGPDDVEAERVGSAYTAAPGNWALASRPVRAAATAAQVNGHWVIKLTRVKQPV